jgi:hypothetical protein
METTGSPAEGPPSAFFPDAPPADDVPKTPLPEGAPPAGLPARRGSLPALERRLSQALPETMTMPSTPTGAAKRMLTELVMTPPKTPPPAGLTPKKGGAFFPVNDRLRALRIETGGASLHFFSGVSWRRWLDVASLPGRALFCGAGSPVPLCVHDIQCWANSRGQLIAA